MFLMPAVYMFSRFIFEKALSESTKERKWSTKSWKSFGITDIITFLGGSFIKDDSGLGVFSKNPIVKLRGCLEKTGDYILNEDICYFIGSIRISSEKISCDSQIPTLHQANWCEDATTCCRNLAD